MNHFTNVLNTMLNNIVFFYHLKQLLIWLYIIQYLLKVGGKWQNFEGGKNKYHYGGQGFGPSEWV